MSTCVHMCLHVSACVYMCLNISSVSAIYVYFYPYTCTLFGVSYMYGNVGTQYGFSPLCVTNLPFVLALLLILYILYYGVICLLLLCLLNVYVIAFGTPLVLMVY